MSCEGNITQLGFIIHGCRGFASSIIEASKIAEKNPKKGFQSVSDEALASEVKESLRSIRLIAITDP